MQRAYAISVAVAVSLNDIERQQSWHHDPMGGLGNIWRRAGRCNSSDRGSRLAAAVRA